MMSPCGCSVRPRKKWLKPISYRVAAEAKVAMWPPTLVFLLARRTMAMAFQRTSDLILRSSSRSPGNGTWASTGTVLT